MNNIIDQIGYGYERVHGGRTWRTTTDGKSKLIVAPVRITVVKFLYTKIYIHLLYDIIHYTSIHITYAKNCLKKKWDKNWRKKCLVCSTPKSQY